MFLMSSHPELARDLVASRGSLQCHPSPFLLRMTELAAVTAAPAGSSRLVANTWPARRSTGGDAALWFGGAVCAMAVGLAIVAAAMAPSASVLVWAVLAAVVAAVGLGVLLWGLAYRRLTYALGEQSLDITWFGQTLVVPY